MKPSNIPEQRQRARSHSTSRGGREQRRVPESTSRAAEQAQSRAVDADLTAAAQGGHGGPMGRDWPVAVA